MASDGFDSSGEATKGDIPPPANGTAGYSRCFHMMDEMNCLIVSISVKSSHLQIATAHQGQYSDVGKPEKKAGSLPGLLVTKIYPIRELRHVKRM